MSKIVDFLSPTFDTEVLGIQSPRNKVTAGPFVLVAKNEEERWAIVAFEWENSPRLGFRWFWPTKGFPLSENKEVQLWTVIPPTLSINIINGLQLGNANTSLLLEFLMGEIKGEYLQNKYTRL